MTRWLKGRGTLVALLSVTTLALACSSGDAGAGSVVVFEDVNVIPIASDGVLEGQTVIVRDGRISEIGPSADDAVPSGAQVIAGEGRYLVPGLVDLHAHPMTEDDLLLYLANGVTWIRALWGEPSILELREGVESGEIDGPSLYVAGPIVDGAVPIHYGTVALGDPADAAAVVQQQKDAGYDYVKIYSGMSLEVFDAVDEASKELDMPFAGHIPIAVHVDRVVESGMRTTEHMFGYLAGVQADSVPVNIDAGFADPEAQAYVARIGRGEIDPQSIVDPAKVQSLGERLAASDVALVPTVVVHEGIVRMEAEPPPEVRYLNVGVQHMWSTAATMMAAFSGPDVVAGNTKLLELQKELLGELHAAGATILVGTDAPNPNVPTGFSVATEIEKMVEIGMTPQEALSAATLGAARLVGDESERGHVTTGAVADLLLLSDNPIDDLGALRDPVGVMHGGRWYDGEDLRQRLEGIVAANEELERRFSEVPVLEGPAFGRADFVADDGRQFGMVTSFVPGVGGPPTLSIDAASRSGADAEWKTFGLGSGGSGLTLRIGKDEPTTLRLETEAGVARLLNGDEVVREEPLTVGAALLFTGTEADLAVANVVFATLEVGGELEVQAWHCSATDAPPSDCDEPVVESWIVTRQPDQVIDGHFYYTGTRVFEIARADGTSVGTWFIGGGGYEGQPVSRVDASASAPALRRVR